MIRSECHSDDFLVNAKFDATPWFEAATEDEIVNLCRQEWGGDYGADAIVHALQGRPGYETVDAMFSYLGHRPRTGAGEAISFEVNVHAPDALRWLLANRRDVFDEVAVVQGIDEDEEAHLTAMPADAPGWDSDPSWTSPNYDRPRPEPTGKIEVYVRAEGKPSHTLDAEIAGDYLLELDGTLEPEEYASAALDIFHSKVAVKILDDFSFSVFAVDGTELDDKGTDYELKNRGSLCGKVDGVAFETKLGRAP